MAGGEVYEGRKSCYTDSLYPGVGFTLWGLKLPTEEAKAITADRVFQSMIVLGMNAGLLSSVRQTI